MKQIKILRMSKLKMILKYIQKAQVLTLKNSYLICINKEELFSKK